MLFKRFFFFEEIWVKNNRFSSCIRILVSKMSETFLILTHLAIQTRISPKLLTCFLSERSQSNTFFLLPLDFSTENHHFRQILSMQWNFDVRDMPQGASILNMPRCSNSKFFCSTWSTFPSNCWLRIFYLRQIIRFCATRVFSSESEWEPWRTKKGKNFMVLRYLDIPFRSFRKLQISVLLARSELTVICF